MGKYTFTWEHYAQEVFVTGTFDDWRKTVRLDKEDGIFKKSVELPKTHTQYKFVVDGNWCTNETARKEDDGHGIINNVLLPEDIVDEPVSTLSSAAPASTTAALAGSVPKESEKELTKSVDSLVPGAFPQTPAAETPGSEPQTFNVAPIPATAGLGNPVTLAAGEPVPEARSLTDNTIHSTVKHDKEPEEEANTFGVAPIPATAGLGNPIHLAPGEKVPDASSLTDNTIHSTVKHDKEPEEEASTFGVAPLPATAGLGNPIHLAPGEKVPDASTFSPHTVDSTVTTDAASYEKSAGLPPLAFTPQAERDANGGMFALPPVSSNLVPESSLPMGVDSKIEQDTGVTIQSAAPASSTAVLAGLVPKESRSVPEVPEAVTESQKEAGVAPEAAANAEAVHEKKEVEEELKTKVPEAPAAADNSYTSAISSNLGTAATAAAAGVTAGAGLFAAAIYSAKDKAADAVGVDGNTTAADVQAKAANAVGLDSNNTAADAKAKAANAVGLDSNNTVADAQAKAATAVGLDSTNPAADAKAKAASAFGLNGSTTTFGVPAVVSESQKEAHVGPEAASNAEAVREKSAFEQELLSEVPKTTETGAPAPAIAVPEIVAESQQAAHVNPEASANSEAVAEKKTLEAELLSKLPKTDETGVSAPVIAAATAGAAAVTGAAATGAAFAFNKSSSTPAPEVPAVVAESQKEAHASPEAAANPEAVAEKKTLEAELLSKLPKTDETGVSAPVIAAATAGAAAVTGAAVTGAAFAFNKSSSTPAPEVPAVVAESQKEAHASPEAAANPEAVHEKKAVETELLKEVKSTDATGAPAPSAAIVSTPVAAVPAKVDNTKPIDANTNVAFTKQEPTTTQQTAPVVTTGIESNTTAATSSAAPALAPETPKKDALRKDSDVSPKGTPGSQSLASGADDKKKKRRSIFGKIKDKLSSKH